MQSFNKSGDWKTNQTIIQQQPKKKSNMTKIQYQDSSMEMEMAQLDK